MIGRQAFGAAIAGLLAGILALTLLPSSPVAAQSGAGQRTKTISVQVTQNVWRLISAATGQMICEVIIEHDGPPTIDEAVVACSQIILVTPTAPPFAATTPTPGPTPVTATGFLQGTYWRYVTTREFSRDLQVPLADIIVNLNAPSQPVTQPYVILTGYDPVLEYSIIQLQGLHNGKEFTCEGSRCELPLNGDSWVELWAISSNGDVSHHVRANVSVIQETSGYVVKLHGLQPFYPYADACASIWEIPLSQPPEWASFPQSPDELNTGKTLHYLASRLIASGVVNAGECPGGGFLTTTSPNGCGMEKAGAAVVKWQNQFDPVIWTSARKVGIPPRLIKTLIERESQFWPGNARYFIYEFGLGQINQLGADVALRWDPDLYRYVCQQYLADCDTEYASQPSYLQATLRGAMMRVINSECASCVNGVDLFNAQQSVGIIAQTLRGNCQQTQFILDQKEAVASYEDMWKFTLASYHSGYQCLFNAIQAVKNDREAINWKNVSARLDCVGGKAYVEDFWAALTSYDTSRLQPETPRQPTTLPTYVPTPTPTPAPTQILANSSIRAIVYIDLNGNLFPDADERVDGLIAQVFFPDGATLARTVTQGEAVFDMSGRVVGLPVTVSLPSLYRSYSTRIIQTGETLVVFRLEPPQMPTAIP